MENQRIKNLSGFSIALREVSGFEGNVALLSFGTCDCIQVLWPFFIIDASSPPPTPIPLPWDASVEREAGGPLSTPSHRNTGTVKVTRFLGSGLMKLPLSVFSPPSPRKTSVRGHSLRPSVLSWAYFAGSLHAYTSVQVAVTKKPGCAAFGEGNPWLMTLGPTAELQRQRQRLRITVTGRPLNKRRHPKNTAVCYQRQGTSGGGGECSRAPKMGC